MVLKDHTQLCVVTLMVSVMSLPHFLPRMICFRVNLAKAFIDLYLRTTPNLENCLLAGQIVTTDLKREFYDRQGPDLDRRTVFFF